MMNTQNVVTEKTDVQKIEWNWFSAQTDKPIRKGDYPFRLCVEGTHHVTKMHFDGERWIGSTGRPFSVLPGDQWAGLDKKYHNYLKREFLAALNG
jgi:hypothetical protein